MFKVEKVSYRPGMGLQFYKTNWSRLINWSCTQMPQGWASVLFMGVSGSLARGRGHGPTAISLCGSFSLFGLLCTLGGFLGQ